MLSLRWTCLVSLLLLQAGHADVRNCACDHSAPESLLPRECSLCKATDAQPGDAPFFVIRDANPNKPRRWLAMPRVHGRAMQDLATMSPDQRHAYWTFAIAKAREDWGESWGLAINSNERRTQCHVHIHIGKMREGVENDRLTVVDGIAQIPLPREGDGLLVHPADGKFHVHHGDDAPELMLER
jgi:CDP-diacylglycerol pyrophosphatase